MLKIAKDFEVDKLTEMCTKVLQQKISCENACTLFQKAQEYKAYDLEDFSQKYIQR